MTINELSLKGDALKLKGNETNSVIETLITTFELVEITTEYINYYKLNNILQSPIGASMENTNGDFKRA